jgi:hypothetical protein
MTTNRAVLRNFAAVAAALGALAAVPAAAPVPAADPTQTVAARQTVFEVRRALERLPYYGVFDFLVFAVERGTVTLEGYAYQGSLRSEAERVVRRVAGVDEVVNKIQVLPASPNDDRIRWATFYAIYTDDFLSRYAPGGPMAVRFALQDFARYPGMQPLGTYPIHIVTSGGRTTLVGIVDTDTDKSLAAIRAREVTGVFAVENDLIVSKP